MYRFSVDRLFRFKRDPSLMCLLEYYITKENGKSEGLLGQIRKIKARNSSEDEQLKI
jgi:hypothetical protein